ncbi:MAG: hypothetical protein ACOYWZ_09530, partial [Bacillota bacterium]
YAYPQPSAPTGYSTAGSIYFDSGLAKFRFHNGTSWESIIDWTVDQGTTNIHDGNITATAVTQYQGSINHNSLAGYVANEHRDWTTDQGGADIHQNNIIQAAITQHQTAIDHNQLLNYDIAQHRVINDAGVSATELWSSSKINSLIGGAGQANTASSAGTGVSLFYQKSGIDLQFNALKSNNTLLSIALNGTTHDIEFTVNEANINHNNLTNVGTNEHLDWTVDCGTKDIHANNIPVTAVTQHQGSINHDALTGFVANEHLDWSTDCGAVDIHANNIPVNAVTQHQASINHDALAGFAANKHLDWTIDCGANNIHDANILASSITQHQASINHDALTGFVANEHLDWTLDQGTANIHDNNILASSITQHQASIDHDALTNFVANKHLDWTVDLGATNIHDGNITATAITQHQGSINHDALTGFVANEHLDWSADQGATNIHDGNITATAITQHQASINHDALSGFVANKHLDWTTDCGVNNIHDANILASSITQHQASINHDALSGFVTNEHLDWTLDQGAVNIHDGNITATAVTQYQASINHNALLNYNVANHRTINDTGTTTTDLWSASKIASEISSAISTGEANTMSNAGTGIGIFYQKSGVNLQLNNIKSENNLLTIALDNVTHDVELTVNEVNIDHNALKNYDSANHRDWSVDQGGFDIHDNNVPLSAVSQHEPNINHNNLKNYLVEEHRKLDDASSTTTNLWSASKIASAISSAISTGEANTASNAGTGNSIFYQKSGVNLLFNGLKSTSNKLTVNTNGTSHDIEFTVVDSNIDHDALTNFAAIEHLDWTTDCGANNIHQNNITAASITQHQASIDHDALTNYSAIKHLDWTIDCGVNNIHDANILASSVTQHQGSINHNALLNYDVAEHRKINDAGTNTTDLWSASKINSMVRDWTIDQGANDIHQNNIPQAAVTQHQAAIDHNTLTNYEANRHYKVDDTVTTTTNIWSATKVNSMLGGAGAFIVDNDSDTIIQVEETADDDTIRFDAKGIEVATITSTEIHTTIPIRQDVATQFKELLTSPTAVSGHGLLYAKNDNMLYFRASDGTETNVLTVGTGENNVGENVGTSPDAAIYKGKSGINLQFNGLESTHTGINVSNNATTNNVEFRIVEANVDHDLLKNFLALEHLDWTTDCGANNIHDGNIQASSIQQHYSVIDHDALMNFAANEHYLQSAITTVGTVTAGNVTQVVDAATDTLAGKIELATAAEVQSGSDGTRAVTPDTLRQSYVAKKSVSLMLVAAGTSCVAQDGAGYLVIPETVNGMNLVKCHAKVISYGTGTNTMDIQFHNMRTGADMLTTKISIDTAETGSETAATSYVIDLTHDDVQEYDTIRIDVDSVHNTTAAKGLIVTLIFAKP